MLNNYQQQQLRELIALTEQARELNAKINNLKEKARGYLVEGERYEFRAGTVKLGNAGTSRSCNYNKLQAEYREAFEACVIEKTSTPRITVTPKA